MASNMFDGLTALVEPLRARYGRFIDGYRVIGRRPPVGDRIFEAMDHCLAGSASTPWEAIQAGAGAGTAETGVGIDATERCAGVIALSTGTTATGTAATRQGIGSVQLGVGRWTCEFRVCVETLRTAGEDFACYVGFHDGFLSAGIAVPTNGACFVYDAASLSWQTILRSAGAGAAVAVAATVTAGQFDTLRIESEPDDTMAGAGQVRWYVNGTLRRAVLTGAPSVVGRRCGIGAGIQKSVGVTARRLLIDSRMVRQELDAER